MDKKGPSVADVSGDLERGRLSYKRRAWADAYQSFSLADKAVPLAVEDLALLAMSAYLIARDDDYLTALERAYCAHLDAGENTRAVRCAFWLGLRLLLGERRAARPDGSPAPGGLSSAKRAGRPGGRANGYADRIPLQIDYRCLPHGEGTLYTVRWRRGRIGPEASAVASLTTNHCAKATQAAMFGRPSA